MVTTSRRPTRRLLSFIKEFTSSLPNAINIQRGKLGINDLRKVAMEHEIDKIIVIHRWKGNPGKIELGEIENSKLKMVPPLMYLAGVKLRKEHGVKGKFKIDSVLLEKNATFKIEKIAKAFSDFISVPLIDESYKRKFKVSLNVSKHSKYEAKITLVSLPSMKEIGPTITVKHTVWENLENK
ncbi:MAG: hypothetical protein QXG01_08600 [Candidatus Bathyarchaeia archaeon]